MIILTATATATATGSAQISAWYDFKILPALIGAFISILTLIVAQVIAGKREKVKYRQTILSWLTISNSNLFILIFQYSMNKEKINYEKLRSELNRVGSFIYILPQDLKVDFMNLVSIHQKSPEEYERDQDKIYPLLVSIVSKLNKYGVEAFGN